MPIFQDINYNCILEGMTSISALIHGRENQCNNRPIYAVLIDASKKRSKYREIGFLKSKAADHGFDIRYVSDADIDMLTQGSTHGGIIALCGERLYEDCDNVVPGGLWVLPDGIEDPFNLGFTLRSLYAAGADGVLLPPQNRMCVPGVVAKSSAGTSELLDIRVCDIEQAIGQFKNAGYKIVCAGIRDSVSIYQADMKKPILLVIGGEKRGISRKLLDKCDTLVRIPYGRDFSASLSAASATTIFAYEIARQNRR